MAAREGKLSGCRLYGVALLVRANGVGTAGVPEGVSILRFRDIGALVEQAPFSHAASVQCSAAQHRGVVERAFRSGAVLPAPRGTLFRGADHVRRWLEQNYIALNEGIHFVAGRCEVRIHVSLRASEESLSQEEVGAAELSAAECFRLLRRDAVASVPIPLHSHSAIMNGAFLIEQARWAEFSEQLRAEALRRRELVFSKTGPWPPYDFVRMDLGS
ncbi:MAG TPA: GvpL/GvpF family gas vesicle protein [Gemmatimonadaceae bacterium]|nr:GvpL/GvpF family gas vesicle protein [Gemmatimonadaceae bacterium]